MGNQFSLIGKSASFYTLGCKLNFSETSTIMRQLIEAGAHKAARGEKADICVINTCSVTEVADKKCRQAIHKIVRENPGAYIVVTGCYGQLQPGTVADIPGVDIVLGQDQKGSVLENLNGLRKRDHGISKTVGTNDIKNFVPSCSRGDRTRFFLKVQDGCDYYCTYCTVPYARGHSRNASIESLVEQARQEGKKWKTDRWRQTFERFDTADAPIAAQLDNIRALALTPPYQPDTIKARLDELAEKRVEIGKLKNELTEIAKKTKNGKAVIAPPASATTEGAKTSKGK